MTKQYQTQRFDTSALAVPEQVSVAMADIAEDMGEGLLAGGRRRPASDERVDGRRRGRVGRAARTAQP